MPTLPPPVLTGDTAAPLRAAAAAGEAEAQCSLDLGRSRVRVELRDGRFRWRGVECTVPGELARRAVHYWDGTQWQVASRFDGGLYKLVPTPWGPPVFEIDGIKMLPSERVSPWEDARDKVALVRPRGRRVLDTCGGLGYFAAWCLAEGCAKVCSFEKSATVMWLREVNPWSPRGDARLELRHADVASTIAMLPDGSFDAALHDPPRFGIAGELYSAAFYGELARVLRPGAPLFHYTGAPNRNSRGRDLPAEVMRRLDAAGFDARREADGVFAVRRRSSSARSSTARDRPRAR